MIFLGTYFHNIDDKNRIALPTKFAKQFTNQIAIISKGFEGCLEIRTIEDFQQRSKEILSYSQNKKDTRILARQILANSHEIELDRANRILLPNNLKSIANLNKEIVLIGLGNKIEIWDAKAYKKFTIETNSKFEAVAERIDDTKNEFNK